MAHGWYKGSRDGVRLGSAWERGLVAPLCAPDPSPHLEWQEVGVYEVLLCDVGAEVMPGVGLPTLGGVLHAVSCIVLAACTGLDEISLASGYRDYIAEWYGDCWPGCAPRLPGLVRTP